MSTLLPPALATILGLVAVLLGALHLIVGLYSMRASLRYRSYVRRVSGARDGVLRGDPPRVLLVVPCCGDEEDLEANLEALLGQDYPGLRVRFAVESEEDRAVPTISRVLERRPGRGELVVAGTTRGRGQKVHNLLRAVESPPDVEVLAFADSDGRPEPLWLRRLVAPLGRPEVGAASSYRFYLPEPASFSTLLRSVWNASILTLLGDHDHNFAWGGSMAIRREVFDRIGVTESWRGALSDDYALTHAVRGAGLRVEFVPSCLVASVGGIGPGELLAWVSRQIAITRVYWPALFRIAAATHLTYSAFLVLAVISRSAASLGLLGLVLLLSFASGGLRARAIAELAPRWRPAIDRHLLAYALMGPLASFLTVAALLRALASRRIEWRGVVYEMISPSETLVVASRRPIRNEAPPSDPPGWREPPAGTRRAAK